MLMTLSLLWLEVGPAMASSQEIDCRTKCAKPIPVLPEILTHETNAKPKEAKPSKPVADARKMSLAEMKSAYGRGALRNPYYNGTAPWQKTFRDVSTSTGNLFKSFTDFQVGTDRGAGLSLQRTYNSNDARVGPFGIGWTHAYDIRIQEANDVATEAANTTLDKTVNNVERTGYFGHKTTYHRDADGLYSPPAYLYDEMSSEYGKFLLNGPPQVFGDTEKGRDGTTQHFTSVVTKADGTSGNERACDYIQDRHGNTTNLAYGLSYTQADGSTRKLLTQVTDSVGRSIVFTWTNLGTAGQPAYRITQAQGPLVNGLVVAGTTVTVAYGYYTSASDPDAGGIAYQLKTVTLDPSGLNRTVTYTYTTFSDGQGNTENGLLASITDSLNHVTSYQYSMVNPASPLTPPGSPVGFTAGTSYYTNSIWVSQINEPGSGGTLSWYIRGNISAGHPLSQTQYYGGVNNYAQAPVSVTVFCNTPGFPHQMAFCSDEKLRLISYGPVGQYGGSEPYIIFYDAANNPISMDSADYPHWTGAPVMTNGNPTCRAMTYGPQGNCLTQGYSESFSMFTNTPPAANPATVSTMTYYNASKYFQPATVTTPTGQVNSTDYYDDQDAAAGNRGEVKYVRDAGYNNPSSPSYQKQTTYTYDQYGNKTSETNSNGIVTQYVYGTSNDTVNGYYDLGNLTQIIQDPSPVVPDGKSHLNRISSMHYDAMGRIIRSTDPRGLTSSVAYNVLGQTTTVNAPATAGAPAETITYAYDSGGRSTGITDNRGTTTIAYEPGTSRVSSVTDPVTGIVSYSYLLSGERVSLAVAGGRTWTYTYMPSNGSSDKYNCVVPEGQPDKITLPLQSISDDQGRGVNYYVTNAGRMIEVDSDQTYNQSATLVSSVNTTITMGGYSTVPNVNTNCITQLQTVLHPVPGSDQLLWKHVYAYAADRLKQSGQITDNAGNVRTETYLYDGIQRLTSVDYGDGQSQTYQFDSMGNRLTKADTVGGATTTTTYGFDAANRLTTLNGNTAAYTNDAAGNTLTGGGRTNVWDSQNRLVSSTMGGVTSTFSYGADGLRRSSTVNGVTTHYVYDGGSLISEKRVNGQSQLVVTASYLAGLRGPECRVDETQQTEGYYNPFDSAPRSLKSRGKTAWYIFDGVSSIAGEADSNGTVTCGTKYDAYGAVRTRTGTSASRQGFAGTFGHVTDTETGLIYMQARYYDPAIGRFTSEDPKCNGLNWFEYANSNPVNFADATGKSPIGSIMNLVNVYGLWLQYFAYKAFVSDMKDLTDSADVEKAWDKFMNGYNNGPLGDYSMEIGLGTSLADWGLDKLLELLEVETSPIVDALTTIVGGVITGASMAILCLAYEMRLEWYDNHVNE